MNSIPERTGSLGAAARHAVSDVKQATRDSLLQPIAEGTREVVQKAQSGCHAMAESTAHDFQRIEAWASQHPVRAIGLAFGAGLFLGVFLFRH